MNKVLNIRIIFKMMYYAVLKGRISGIYTSWEDCKTQTNGYQGAIFKSFVSRLQAESFLKDSTNNSTNNSINNSKLRSIYTDGSCKDKIGGWAFKDGNIEEYGQCPIFPCTNSKAELFAIFKVCEYLQLKDEIVIYSDSDYVVKVFTTWLSIWKKNGYRKSNGSIPENLELILEIYSLISSKSLILKFEHVYAHRGIPENEKVDFLANLGRQNKIREKY